MKIDSIKISKTLERTQINLEKMINDSSKVNECIKVIKKIWDDLVTILFYIDVKDLEQDKFDAFTNVMSCFEDIVDNLENNYFNRYMKEFYDSINVFNSVFKQEYNSFVDERKAKIAFNKSGGTAKGTAITNRVTIPTSWIKELGINQENREVKLTLKDNKITVEKIK
jgi:hypothetical protein